MKIPSPKSNHGFSLVELLLTLVLILCLAAASVFSYTALHRTANLDEGVDRLQSLIRFAQAEAATTGRKVQIKFQAAVPAVDAAPGDLRQIKILVEEDALHAPGVYKEHGNKAWNEDLVNELVGVAKVRPLSNSPEPSPAALLETTGEMTEPAVNDSTAKLSAMTGEMADPGAMYEEEFPAITFYPDGTCDSAEIILASRNDEDGRRLAVRLSGILGSVTSEPVSEAESASEIVDEEFEEAYLEEMFETPEGSSLPSGSSFSSTERLNF